MHCVINWFSCRYPLEGWSLTTKKQKGTQDRSFTPIKVAIHRDSNHQQVLTKSIASVWSDAPEGSQFFLSDGSGCTITNNDFNVDHRNGTTESISWTLANYLQVSGIRYPSRARLYCVHVPPSDDHDKPSDQATSDSEATSSSVCVHNSDDGKEDVPQESIRYVIVSFVLPVYRPSSSEVVSV